MSDLQLVSVGIPTFNRVATLRRSVDSVLQQDYPQIEIIISDNASADGTKTYCEAVAATNRQVRYVRHETNRGAVANFHAALANAQGEYFMWLGDDDWIDQHYISKCVAVFEENRQCSLATGETRYFDSSIQVTSEPPLQLLQESGGERVCDYYGKVTWNSAFYGMMRRRQLNAIPFAETLGGDWLLIAAMAFYGKVFSVNSVVNRSINGGSNNLYSLVINSGAPRWFLFHPRFYFLGIMASVFQDILYRNPIYHTLPIRRRFILACAAPIRIMQHNRVGLSYWIGELRSRLRVRSRVRVFLRRIFLKIPGR